MSQVQQIEIYRLLRILSSFKVQAIRWNMPGQPWNPDHPICVGFDVLEALYIFMGAFNLGVSEAVKDILNMRNQHKQFQLKFLCLESSPPFASSDEGDIDQSQERDSLVNFFRMSVQELGLPEGWVI